MYIYKSLYRVETVAKTTRGYEKVQGCCLQEEAEEKQRWVLVYRQDDLLFHKHKLWTALACVCNARLYPLFSKQWHKNT